MPFFLQESVWSMDAKDSRVDPVAVPWPTRGSLGERWAWASCELLA